MPQSQADAVAQLVERATSELGPIDILVHNAGGDIPLALKPGFNTIHLFRVPQMHSVSYVAPFAAVPRYAITGWLRR